MQTNHTILKLILFLYFLRHAPFCFCQSNKFHDDTSKAVKSIYELPYSVNGKSYDWKRLWVNTARKLAKNIRNSEISSSIITPLMSGDVRFGISLSYKF